MSDQSSTTKDWLCTNCDLQFYDDEVLAGPDAWPLCPDCSGEVVDPLVHEREQAQAACEQFNEAHPVGVTVQYTRPDGEVTTHKTTAQAMPLSNSMPVVWLSGVTGCVALSHVEPGTAEQLAAQRRVDEFNQARCIGDLVRYTPYGAAKASTVTTRIDSKAWVLVAEHPQAPGVEPGTPVVKLSDLFGAVPLESIEVLADDDPAAVKSVAEFNDAHPPGTPVMCDGHVTTTKGHAWVMGEDTPVVQLNGVPGNIVLKRVKPLPERTNTDAGLHLASSFEGAIAGLQIAAGYGCEGAHSDERIRWQCTGCGHLEAGHQTSAAQGSRPCPDCDERHLWTSARVERPPCCRRPAPPPPSEWCAPCLAQHALDSLPDPADREAPDVPAAPPRTALRRLAALCEVKLRKHDDDRPGWADANPFDLLGSLRDEVAELDEALFELTDCDQFDDTGELLNNLALEAADVANFAMMVADTCGALDVATDGLAADADDLGILVVTLSEDTNLKALVHVIKRAFEPFTKGTKKEVADERI